MTIDNETSLSFSSSSSPSSISTTTTTTTISSNFCSSSAISLTKSNVILPLHPRGELNENCRVCGDAGKRLYTNSKVILCFACTKFLDRSLISNNSGKYKCRVSGNCAITRLSRGQCAFCRYQKCLSVGLGKPLEDRRNSTELNKLGNISNNLSGENSPSSSISRSPTSCPSSAAPSDDTLIKSLERTTKNPVVNEEKFSQLLTQSLCVVCESKKATGIHFGAISCENCKAFFRRVKLDESSTLRRLQRRFRCEYYNIFETKIPDEDHVTLQELLSDEVLAGGPKCPMFSCGLCRFLKCISVGMRINIKVGGRYSLAFKYKVTKQLMTNEKNCLPLISPDEEEKNKILNLSSSSNSLVDQLIDTSQSTKLLSVNSTTISDGQLSSLINGKTKRNSLSVNSKTINNSTNNTSNDEIDEKSITFSISDQFTFAKIVEAFSNILLDLPTFFEVTPFDNIDFYRILVNSRYFEQTNTLAQFLDTCAMDEAEKYLEVDEKFEKKLNSSIVEYYRIYLRILLKYFTHLPGFVDLSQYDRFLSTVSNLHSMLILAMSWRRTLRDNLHRKSIYSLFEDRSFRTIGRLVERLRLIDEYPPKTANQNFIPKLISSSSTTTTDRLSKSSTTDSFRDYYGSSIVEENNRKNSQKNGDGNGDEDELPNKKLKRLLLSSTNYDNYFNAPASLFNKFLKNRWKAFTLTDWNAIDNIVQLITNLNLDREEFALFAAYLSFSPSINEMEQPTIIYEKNMVISSILQRYIRRQRGQIEGERIYLILMNLRNDFLNINDLLIDQLRDFYSRYRHVMIFPRFFQRLLLARRMNNNSDKQQVLPITINTDAELVLYRQEDQYIDEKNEPLFLLLHSPVVKKIAPIFSHLYEHQVDSTRFYNSYLLSSLLHGESNPILTYDFSSSYINLPPSESGTSIEYSTAVKCLKRLYDKDETSIKKRKC
ncbi:hypothetical protein SNEBB_000067 [Seison nebaliae]|nr:hypothetical protein SNEBB_000067 [Seison nebaliae]